MGKIGYIRSAVYLFLLLIATNNAAIVDIKTKGAKGDGITDDGPEILTYIFIAIMRAWKEACEGSPPGSLLIPPGNYMSLAVQLNGPCKGPIEINANGATIKAPPELAKFTTESWFSIRGVDKLTMTGGTFDGQGQETWKTTKCQETTKCQIPVNLRFSNLRNSLFKDITSINSKNFHISLRGSDNSRMENININAQGNSLNTDGIHIAKLNGLNITNSKIGTGDDCISFGEGSRNIRIEGVSCGPGHGFSIGSLGKFPNEEPVEGILLKNCTVNRAINGVRIKTWPNGAINGVRIKTWPNSHPGIVRDITFENIIINNVQNPVIVDQEYCPNKACMKGAPSKVKLTNVSFRRIRGTSASKVAMKLICSAEVPCENVEVAGINLTFNGGPTNSQCTNAKTKTTGQNVPGVCAA
ncbi:exopolygalacturonase-like [Bidens hawaiensis]|uniref:exopolygalacturonase-like n=1 Tax=Bidens hawaiensis TaxID=980011 RepID=UPI0040496C65